MAISISATLVDKSGKALSSTKIRAIWKLKSGSAKVLSTSTTSDTGTVTLKSSLTPSDYLPYLYLQAYISKKWQTIDAKPSSYTATKAAFGEVIAPATSTATSELSLSGARVTEIEISDVSIDKTKLTELETTNKALNLQITSLKTSNTSLSQQLASKETELNNIQVERDTAVSEISSLQKSLTDKDKKIAELQADLDAQSPKDTLINKVFENTGNQLEQAQVSLSSQNSKFRLGRVSMEMKVVPGQSGNSIRLADPELIKDIGSDSLSTLTLEFESDDVSNSSSKNDQPKISVPDTSNATRTHAERIIKQQGLIPVWRVENIVEADQSQRRHGRVIHQSPSGGSLVHPRSEVVLTIAQAAIVDEVTA